MKELDLKSIWRMDRFKFEDQFKDGWMEMRMVRFTV